MVHKNEDCQLLATHPGTILLTVAFWQAAQDWSRPRGYDARSSAPEQDSLLLHVELFGFVVIWLLAAPAARLLQAGAMMIGLPGAVSGMDGMRSLPGAASGMDGMRSRLQAILASQSWLKAFCCAGAGWQVLAQQLA